MAAMLAVVGGVLLILAMRLPEFSNVARAEQLFVAWCDNDGKVIDAIGDQYAALRTNRDVFLNAGPAALSAAVTLFLFGWLNPSFRTPTRPWHYFVIGIVVLGWWWGASIYGIMSDFDRMMFPACADSIVIPMFDITVGVSIATIFAVVVGFLVSRRFGALPVEIFRKTAEHKNASVTTFILGAFGLLIVFTTLDTALTADWLAVPAGIVATYLVAATRAALLAPARQICDSAAASR